MSDTEHSIASTPPSTSSSISPIASENARETRESPDQVDGSTISSKPGSSFNPLTDSTTATPGQPRDKDVSYFTFTLGTHEDDVIQLHGAPSRIDIVERLGYETWRYDRGTVEIDRKTRRVTNWTNHGGDGVASE